MAPGVPLTIVSRLTHVDTCYLRLGLGAGLAASATGMISQTGSIPFSLNGYLLDFWASYTYILASPSVGEAAGPIDTDFAAVLTTEFRLRWLCENERRDLHLFSCLNICLKWLIREPVMIFSLRERDLDSVQAS